jgi:hypothetical protein
VNIIALQLDTLLHLPVFKTGALNHSATLPMSEINYLAIRTLEQIAKLPPDCHRIGPKNEKPPENAGAGFVLFHFRIALIAAAALPSSLRNKCAWLLRLLLFSGTRRFAFARTFVHTIVFM